MGVLNLTTDSFSDGGKFNKRHKGIRHAFQMFEAGANIIDVGGEATRPGSKAVNAKLEWSRVEKVEDVVKTGDKVRVKLIKVDDQGRFDFSRKALLEKPEGYVERPKRDNRSRNNKKRFNKRN